MITGVILAHNEESNVVDCIEALRPHVAEVILIDTESDDRTAELARPLVDRVLSHPNLPNFDAIRNIAIPEGRFDWFWFVDADERIPERTGQIVKQLIRERGTEFEAIHIPFKSYFCGQWMQHSGWWPGYTGCRVLKRGHFQFGSDLHSGIMLSGRAIQFPPDPEIAVPHFSYRSLEHYIEKMNRYTSTEAIQLDKKGSRYDWRIAIQRMMDDLWLYYEFKVGRLDGPRGWLLAWMSGQYRWLSEAKLIDLQECCDPQVPESLDEVLESMEYELAASRTKRPLLPLGIVLRTGSRLAGAEHESLVDCAAELVSGDRTVRVDARSPIVVTERSKSFRTVWPYLQRATRSRSEIGIVFDSPAVAKRHRAEVACVLVTRWPSVAEEIPTDWIQTASEFDEVWVESSIVKTALRQRGLAPERIRQLPPPIDHNAYIPFGPCWNLPEQLLGRCLFVLLCRDVLEDEIGILAYCQEFSSNEKTGLIVVLDPQHRRPNFHENVPTYVKDRLEVDVHLVRELVTATDMAAIYRSSDALIAGTRGLQYSRGIREALACGLPILAGNESADLDPGLNCIQSPAIEEPERASTGLTRLRSSMRHFYSNPELRTRLRRDLVSRSREEGNGTLNSYQRATEQAFRDIEARFAPPLSPPVAADCIRVEIEGELFASHSFSNVNEQVIERLAALPSLEVSVRRLYYNPTLDLRASGCARLLGLVGRELGGPPDIVIRHAYPPNWNPPPAGLWVHIQPWEFGSLPVDWIPHILDRVDEVWVPSNYVKRVYVDSGIPPEKIEVIPWGIDPSVFNPKVPPRLLETDKTFRFLFVGGTIPRKGFDRVLEAYLEEFGPEDDVCLVVKDVGTGTFYAPDNSREQILAASREESNPRILYTDDDYSAGQLASLYCACHCLVAPYRGEGFALPVLEAMACGLVPIVPRGGPTDDFVSVDTGIVVEAREVPNNSVTGLCLPATEFEVSIGALRKAMRAAYLSQSSIREVGMHAAESVHSRFTWDLTVKEMMKRIEVLRQRTDEKDLGLEGTQGCPFAIVIVPTGNDHELAESLCNAKMITNCTCLLDQNLTPRARIIAAEYGVRIVAPRLEVDSPLLEDVEWTVLLQANESLSERESIRLASLLREVPQRVSELQVSLMHPDASSPGGREETRVYRSGRHLIRQLSTRTRQDGECTMSTDIQVNRASSTDLGDLFRKLEIRSAIGSRVREVAQSASPLSAILIQLATEKHRELLDLTRKHHQAYAQRHGLEYLRIESNPAAPKRPGWGKIRLILGAMQMGFDRIIWLDSDAVIVDPQVNLATLVEEGIGMVRHPNFDRRASHWNSGVMLVASSDATRRFFEAVDAEPENDNAWMEQLAINVLADGALAPRIVELSPAFNCTPGAVESQSPVIQAAHGLPFEVQRQLISEWLESAC